MEKLLSILHSLHPDADFEHAENLYGEGLLDSLDMVRLVTEIDRAFDVRVPAEELIPENFATVRSIWNLIERLDED